MHRKLAQAGLLCPELPVEKGGRGATPYASHAAAEVREDHRWSSHAKGATMMVAAQTKAVPEGNTWRIHGTKTFTSGADICDDILILTRTNPDVAKHKGLTMFIVPTKARCNSEAIAGVPTQSKMAD